MYRAIEKKRFEINSKQQFFLRQNRIIAKTARQLLWKTKKKNERPNQFTSSFCVEKTHHRRFVWLSIHCSPMPSNVHRFDHTF